MGAGRGTTIAAALVVAALLLVVAFVDGSSPRGRARRAADDPAATQDVEVLVRQLREAWQPQARAALLASARADAQRHEPALRAVLARPGHPLLVDCIPLVAALELADLHPALVEHALEGSIAVRPAAIVAAAALAPWETAAMLELLDDPDDDVVVAALSVLPADAAPWATVIELLDSASERVRAAAFAALPSPPPEPVLVALRTVLRDGDPQRGEAAIRALAGPSPSPEVEALLVAQLDSPEAAFRLGALEALLAKQTPLRDPAPLRACALRGSSPTEQAMAFLVLERGGVRPDADLARSLPLLHPLPRYFAARGLLGLGERGGLAALADVCEASDDDFAPVAAEIAEATRLSAASILADLSGTDPYAGAPVWRQWLTALDHFEPVELAPPQFPLR